MATSNRIVNIILVTGLLAVAAPLVQADSPSYGSEIGNKALNGFANIITAPLEIPKNVINTTNQSNIFYGLVGGTFKGIVNTGGRIGVGVADLVTFPIPTKPIAYPLYIWDDFDVDTTYGEVYRLDQTQYAPEPVETVVAPPAQAPAPIVSAPAVAPRAPGYDQGQYGQDTNRKLDALFKNKMKK